MATSINERFLVNERVITFGISNTDTQADYYVSYPYSNSRLLDRIDVVVGVAVATNACTFTPYINGTAVAGGVVTVATSVAAGGLVSASSTLKPLLKTNDIIKVTVGGNSTGSGRVHINLVTTPSS